MLKEVTSLADYFNKVKQEKRYQKAIIKAYKYNYGETISYKKALAWMDGWIKKNITSKKDGRTCFAMSDFLNRFIREMNEREKVLAERRAVAVRVGVPPAVTDPTLGIAAAPEPLL